MASGRRPVALNPALESGASPPPRSPEFNGHVERGYRILTEEFYEVTESSFDVAELKEELLE